MSVFFLSPKRIRLSLSRRFIPSSGYSWSAFHQYLMDGRSVASAVKTIQGWLHGIAFGTVVFFFLRDVTHNKMHNVWMMTDFDFLTTYLPTTIIILCNLTSSIA